MPGFVCQGNNNTQEVAQKHQKSFKGIFSFSLIFFPQLQSKSGSTTNNRADIHVIIRPHH